MADEGKVVRLADFGDSVHYTPRQALEAMADFAEKEGIEKIFAIGVMEEPDGKYWCRYTVANMKVIDVFTALSYMKAICQRWMGLG